VRNLDTRDACEKVRQCVKRCLTPRERAIITMRYGLDDKPPRARREVAEKCGIYDPVCRAALNVNEARKV